MLILKKGGEFLSLHLEIIITSLRLNAFSNIKIDNRLINGP